MNLLKKYLASKRITIFLFFTFFFVHLFFFALFQIPSGVVLYAAVCCGVIGSFFMIPDFLSFREKHNRLKSTYRQKVFDMEQLPGAVHLLEEDYRNIIGRLVRERNCLDMETDKRYAEMIDYYTVWVHQIKTPIASMHLTLQGEDSSLSRKLKTDLLEIEQYVEMVLCYLRLDSESTDYVIRRVNLDGMIKREVKKFAPQFIRKKLRLQYESLGCDVLTDEKWLAFVIGQLLSNAVKYTKKGSIEIFMESPWILCIRDTGIGIAKEDLPRIFEKGFTGFNGRADKKASGIGLYLCKRICDNLGHKITVDSVMGEGTVVRIDLESPLLEME